QQYKFIHECLLCVLEGREEDITYMNFGQVNAAFEGELIWHDLFTSKCTV
ncbi:tyrosine-protein phosphatase 10D, partial [Biomphalaria glabrata]